MRSRHAAQAQLVRASPLIPQLHAGSVMTSLPMDRQLRAITALLLVAGASPAFAMPAGLIEFAIGRVLAISGDGRDRELAKGSPVESGDRVLTREGRAQIRFSDGGYVSLAPNTDYLIKSYRFDGAADGSEQAVFTLVKGAMRTVSGMVGRVNRSAYRLETPTATIGIRGTGGVIAILDDGATLLTGTSGVWVLANAAGQMEVPAGSTGYAGPQADRAPQRMAGAAVLPVPGIGERPFAIAGPLASTPYVSADKVRADGMPSGIAIVPTATDTVLPMPSAASTGADSVPGMLPPPTPLPPSHPVTIGPAANAPVAMVPKASAPVAIAPAASGPVTSEGGGGATPAQPPSAPVPEQAAEPVHPGVPAGSIDRPSPVVASTALAFAGVAYAYADPRDPARVAIGNDGSDREAQSAGTRRGYELKSFDIGRVQANHGGKPGDTIDQGGASGTLGWGRWTGGAALGGGGGAIRFGANGGLHYFTGMPTPVADMPKGEAVYNLAGATRPTVADESLAPGSLENARMRVDFDRARVGVQFDIRFPAVNASYQVSTSGGLADVAGSQVQIEGSGFAGSGALARNAADCAAGCATRISGGFVGPGAEGAGFAYQIRGVAPSAPSPAAAAPATTTIHGAAAFVR